MFRIMSCQICSHGSVVRALWLISERLPVLIQTVCFCPKGLCAPTLFKSSETKPALTSGTPINILHGICMVYTIHIPGILHSAGIYVVYTIHIHCILNFYFILFFRILLLGTNDMGVYKAMYTPEKK